MSALESLIDEINELKDYQKLYESQKKDKAKMSEMLFELMIEKYNNTSYEERVKQFNKETCSCCRGMNYCDRKLPEDIMKPIPSDKSWIPATKSCGSFEWD